MNGRKHQQEGKLFADSKTTKTGVLKAIMP